MNLGVETRQSGDPEELPGRVSAFSDESWGGDRFRKRAPRNSSNVSAFSDESWGGDPPLPQESQAHTQTFQHSLMNLGVETL